MAISACLRTISKDFEYDQSQPVKVNLLSEYERVIVESLITSFGLDALLVKDQYGGDVDTVHNVDKIINPNSTMEFKNKEYAEAYDRLKKTEYNDKIRQQYHNGNKKYTKARQRAKSGGKTVTDAYTGETLRLDDTGPASLSKANLDHVISAKEIYEDPHRILVEKKFKGEDLANDDTNLAFTNEHLNKSMQDKKIEEYIEGHPEQLDEATKKRMLEKDKQARKAYKRKIIIAYYGGRQFWEDTAVAAANVGVRMGARQALGMVFLEMWIGVREEWQKITDWTVGNIFSAIGRGIRSGFESAMKKYKEILARFKEDALAGILSSVTTTLCNVFFTTAKKAVRMIRQIWPSLVQAAKILFMNPDMLPLGEQIRATLKILSAGISVVAGTMVSETLSVTGIGNIKPLGTIAADFCGAFVTGIMGCTAVYILDNSEKVQKLIEWINQFDFSSSALTYFQQQAALFEAYAAQLMNIDIEQFKKETAAYESIADQMETAETEERLNEVLLNAFKKQGIPLPWSGDFDEFMGNRSNHLVFQ